MPCEAIYFSKSKQATVTCGDPFAFPVIIAGTLCSVKTHLCELHENGFIKDGYLVSYAEPETLGIVAS